MEKNINSNKFSGRGFNGKTSGYANEEMFQAACTQWFWNTYPEHRRMLFQVQQNAQNRIIGARHKATGVVRGPSDLVFVRNGSVVFIELKMPGGVQSEEQIDFQQKVIERGHVYRVISPPLSNFQLAIKSMLTSQL